MVYELDVLIKDFGGVPKSDLNISENIHVGRMGESFLPPWRKPDVGKLQSKPISVTACLTNFCPSTQL